MILNREEMQKMLDQIAEEHERLKRIKRTYRCPACGEIIEGYAYPMDDLDDRIQEHLQKQHGLEADDTK